MPILEMRSITKKFPPETLALNHVSLSVEEGEIHCLLGENGAGKTTLMNILFGLYQPDKGQILVRDIPVKISSPKVAIDLGIGMVHQHFSLVQQLSVAENIALGFPPSSLMFPLKAARKIVGDISKRYGLNVDFNSEMWQLSVGEQQRVEILKILSKNAKILILDEPTSILTLQETGKLFEALKRLVAEGHTIIFITHKLDEVMRVSDRVTVLRKGVLVETVETETTNEKELARMMVGQDILSRLEKPSALPGEIVLDVIDICALNDRGLPALNDVSFSVRESEILGVAGVAGNGQSELIEVLTGLRKATKGSVVIRGENMTNRSPKDIAKAGVAHIPEERVRMGIVNDLSVADNLILREYEKPPFSNRMVLIEDNIRRHAVKLVSEYNILTPSIRTPAKLLSGGNIQRLILARELHGSPRLIIASHPTYGLDVAATEQTRRILLEQRRQGAAILLVSEDLDEILSISDRVLVLFKGNVMKIVDADEARLEEIGMMMAGTRIDEGAS